MTQKILILHADSDLSQATWLKSILTGYKVTTYKEAISQRPESESLEHYRSRLIEKYSAIIVIASTELFLHKHLEDMAQKAAISHKMVPVFVSSKPPRTPLWFSSYNVIDYTHSRSLAHNRLLDFLRRLNIHLAPSS